MAGLTAGGRAVYRDSAGVLREESGRDQIAALEQRVTEIDQSKANASTVGGISTALDAIRDKIPAPADVVPMPETTGGAVGEPDSRYALATHRHPRQTSTTIATVGAGNTVTLTFTRPFDIPPGMVLTEIGGSTAAAAQPAVFKVESWVQTGGKYTGCVVRAWRSQTVPQNLATLLLGAVFNLFSASAQGTVFSCIAVARSDV